MRRQLLGCSTLLILSCLYSCTSTDNENSSSINGGGVETNQNALGSSVVLPSSTNEFLVNTHISGSHTNPSAAMDADGNFVVTWDSEHQDDGFRKVDEGSGVYAQRFDSRGMKQGEEFLVNTYTSNDQAASSVAMNAEGNFVITWASRDQNAGFGRDGNVVRSTGVYAQRFDSRGMKQGKEFRVNTYITDSQGHPSVAMDSDGDFVITWSSFGQDGDSTGIYAQRFDSAGVKQGEEFLVNTSTSDAQVFPSVAIDSDGDFVIAWESYFKETGKGSVAEIYVQRFDSRGMKQGEEFLVNTTTSFSRVPRYPSVAMDSDGDFVCAWIGGGLDGGKGIYAQRFDNAGVKQGEEFLVNTSTLPSAFEKQANFSMAMHSEGNFVITWNLADGSKVYAQRFDSAGVKQDEEFLVHTSTSDTNSEFSDDTSTSDSHTNPSVAMDADGDFVIVWKGDFYHGDRKEILAKLY